MHSQRMFCLQGRMEPAHKRMHHFMEQRFCGGGANNCPFFKTIGQFRADKEYYRPMEKAYLAKRKGKKAKEDK